MPDPTDPRAVADDPSGIVQQMPEVGPRGPVPDDVLHHGAWQMADDLEGWFPSHNMARYADMMRDLAFDLRNARATEADLLAEVERLRAQAKGMTALLRAGCDLLAIESEALRNSISIIGDPDRLSDDPEDAPTIETINEIEDWIASVKATLFPPALPPETDGGHDA